MMEAEELGGAKEGEGAEGGVDMVFGPIEFAGGDEGWRVGREARSLHAAIAEHDPGNSDDHQDEHSILAAEDGAGQNAAERDEDEQCAKKSGDDEIAAEASDGDIDGEHGYATSAG